MILSRACPAVSGTHVALDPVDFIARVATLVGKPRVNLTRYHGVLAFAARPKSPLARVGHTGQAWQGSSQALYERLGGRRQI